MSNSAYKTASKAMKHHMKRGHYFISLLSVRFSIEQITRCLSTGIVKDLLRETILKIGIKQGDSISLSITGCIVGPVRPPPPVFSSATGDRTCPPYQPAVSIKGDGRNQSLAQCPALLDPQVR